MYFDFEDHRPDTPTIPRPMSAREVVLITVNLHLVFLVVVLLGPRLPFIKALEAKRRLEQVELQRRLEEQKAARFVFVEPKVDIKSLTPRPEADLSDEHRRARTIERAPNPSNALPFSRGNSPERVETPESAPGRRAPAPAPEPAAQPAQPGAMTLPDRQPAPESPRPEAREPRSSVGVIADAIRNVQKYTKQETFSNLGGGGLQDIAPSIQFDTKGVEFGPWLRRFVAQIRRNWEPPYAAMSMRGHVVITFYVHKDGRISDIIVAKPSSVEGFTHSSRNAIAMSNPTNPLPPEYPDDKAFFTVTFYYNENPS